MGAAAGVDPWTAPAPGSVTALSAGAPGSSEPPETQRKASSSSPFEESAGGAEPPDSGNAEADPSPFESEAARLG